MPPDTATATAAAPDTERAKPGEWLIDHLKDRLGSDPGLFATLRRGRFRGAAQQIEVPVEQLRWQFSEARRNGTVKGPGRDIDLFNVAYLYAHYQHGNPIHRPPVSGWTVGRALRPLVPAQPDRWDTDPTVRRITAAFNRRSSQQLVGSLRPLVGQLRADGHAPPDWALLVAHLTYWERDRRLRLRWASDLFAANQTDSDTNGDTTDA